MKFLLLFLLPILPQAFVVPMEFGRLQSAASNTNTRHLARMIATDGESSRPESTWKSPIWSTLMAIALSTAAPAALAVSGGGLDFAGLDISGQDFSKQNYKGKDFTQGTNEQRIVGVFATNSHQALFHRQFCDARPLRGLRCPYLRLYFWGRLHAALSGLGLDWWKPL